MNGTAPQGQAELPPLAYLVGRYPTVSHTFVLREVRGLREQGVRIRTFAIWRSKPDQVLSQVDREEAAATVSLLPPVPMQFMRAHWQAMRAGPGAYLRMLRTAVALSSPGLRHRALGLTWFAEAALLWMHLREGGIRHVHVHLNGSAPNVALLATRFGTQTDPDGRPWSFSMTVHGSKEFYDVVHERLDAKVAAARFVVCISDYTRSQVMGLVALSDWPKLHVVRCGVPAGFSAVALRPERLGPIELLTVARLDPMKGLPVLLQALALLRQQGRSLRLTVIGDGPARRELEAEAVRLGIGDAISWCGAVGQDHIASHYAACDVFCLPSFAEGLPTVLVEAMLCGVPVVATRVHGVPELVEDGVCGLLVSAARADQLAVALARLADDPALRRRLGEAGRQRAREQHDLGRSVAELRSLFGHYLGSRDATQADGAQEAAPATACVPQRAA